MCKIYVLLIHEHFGKLHELQVGAVGKRTLTQLCTVLPYKPLLFYIFFGYEPIVIATIKTRATRQNLCVDNETDKLMQTLLNLLQATPNETWLEFYIPQSCIRHVNRYAVCVLCVCVCMCVCVGKVQITTLPDGFALAFFYEHIRELNMKFSRLSRAY